VVNDTQAVALSLPALAPADLQPLTKTNPLPQATKLALTVGTGFGTATAIWTGEKWLALAGEGGHALMPMSHHARGNAVLQDLQQRLGVVTIANVVSGVGMRNLYDSIARLEGKEGTPIPEAEAIAAAARAGDESVAVETMRLFLESLAAVTYNFAMTTLAIGGVYLTGGVAPRLGPFIEADDYLKRSFAEIPFPVSLVTRENPAFLGLAQLL
jgi:glucokinase